MPAYILPQKDQLSIRIKEARCVEAAGALEPFLVFQEKVGKAWEKSGIQREISLGDIRISCSHPSTGLIHVSPLHFQDEDIL